MKKHKIMFVFIKRMFIVVTGFIRLSIVNSLNAIPLKFVSMVNQECKVRLIIMNINCDESSFYPYSIPVNKYSGNCNNINNPYANYVMLLKT